MNYIGEKCPVCDKYFHEGDDVVVCPDCGTPHHRECYEINNKCANETLHGENFEYKSNNSNAENKSETNCKYCGFPNDKDAFFCSKCGAPIDAKNNTQNKQSNNTTYNDRQQENKAGYSPPFSMDMMDPLAGVPKDFDLGDGVTAGEAAKYVKQNTPYFIRIFTNIKNFSKSKFNFAAAIFTGGYLLYRKMYKLGAVIASIQAAIMLLTLYIAYCTDYTTIANHISGLNASATGSNMETFNSLMEYISTLSVGQIFLIILPSIFEIINIVMMLVIGGCANRLYFAHCKKQIIKIKAENAEKIPADEKLETKGGVNTALAISLLVSYFIINYLPRILISII